VNGTGTAGGTWEFAAAAALRHRDGPPAATRRATACIELRKGMTNVVRWRIPLPEPCAAGTESGTVVMGRQTIRGQ
jgi:hypothetical protein